MTVRIEEDRRLETPAERSGGLGRWLVAAVLVLGGALQLAEFLLEPDHPETASRLAWWSQHESSLDWSQAAGIAAILSLLVGVVVMWQLTRVDSPKLATTAAVVLGSAMIGIALVHGVELAAHWALDAGHGDAAKAILDVKQPRLPGIVGFVMFLPAAVVGNLLMTAALWRSRFVPKAAAVLVVVFVVLDFAIGQEVISHATTLLEGLLLGWVVVTGYQRKARPAVATAAQ
jgi:hypothetical protein